MPDLDKELFRGGSEVKEEDLAKCEVNNLGEDVTNVLTSFDWEGGPAACILLQLTPDNERIAAGTLITRGRDEKEYTLDVSKVWQDANMGITLTIRLPELDSYTFTDGGMTSDFLPDEECIHFFHATKDSGASTPILSANLAQHGIGRFCTRLVCQPAKASSVERGIVIKYTCMLFPASRGELLQMTEQVSSGSWPGIRLGDGEMPLLPRPSVNWGCPVIPLIRPAIAFSVLGRAELTSPQVRNCRHNAEMQRTRELQERGQPPDQVGQGQEKPSSFRGEGSTGDLARASAAGTDDR